MYVEHNVTIDLLRRQKNVIHVVQDDSTRKIILTLLKKDAAYDITEDLEQGEDWIGMVSYKKSDGTCGQYEETSDGITAVSLVDDTTNVFEVALDGQCFTASGNTLITVCFMTEDGKSLHTFPIDAFVHPNGCSETESNDFYNLQSIADIRTAMQNALYFVAQTLTAAQKTQARENIGAADAADVTALGTIRAVGFCAETNNFPHAYSQTAVVRKSLVFPAGRKVGDLVINPYGQLAYIYEDTTDPILGDPAWGIRGAGNDVVSVVKGCVRYDTEDGANALTSEQKAQARTNIGAAPLDGPTFTGTVSVEDLNFRKGSSTVNMEAESGTELGFYGDDDDPVELVNIAPPTSNNSAATKIFVRQYVEEAAELARADVSEAYAEQSEYTTPQEYLASLDEGRYIIANEWVVCIADNVPLGEFMASHSWKIDDDSFLTEYYYVNEELKKQVEDNGATTFETPVIIQPPTENYHPARLDTVRSEAVTYAAQTGKTSAQKAQARANIDAATASGTESDLTAGLAKNLVTSKGTTDDAAYSTRTAGAETGPYLELKKVVGMTLGWNQAAQIESDGSYSAGGVTTTFSAHNGFTVSGTPTSTSAVLIRTATGNTRGFTAQNKIVAGHVYLVDPGCDISATNYNLIIRPMATNDNIFSLKKATIAASEINAEAWRLVINGLTADTEISTFSGLLQIFDLTEMFGSTVANAVLALETATPGAGVLWFRKYFSEEYYGFAYGLQSVKASAHKITISGTAHSYALDGSKELRGLPTLDAGGNLTADGDEYAPNGTITRKYAAVDLGSLEWTYDDTNKIFGADLPAAAEAVALDAVPALKAVGYDAASVQTISGDLTADKKACFSLDSAVKVFVRDLDYTDAASFTAAVDGKVMVYKLAAPTTESAAAYPESQLAAAGCTEEFVDAAVAAGTRDVAVPVGNSTFYPTDLRAEMERVMVEVPPAPSSDGTYVLQCTVSSGVKTFSWVSNI